MYPSFHSAVAVLIQKFVPGALGVILSFGSHFVVDNLIENGTYGNDAEAIVFELSLNWLLIDNIIENERKEEYLWAIFAANLPDIINKSTGLLAHGDTPFNICASDLGPYINCLAIWIAIDNLKEEQE